MSMLIKLFALVIQFIFCKCTMENVRITKLTGCTCPGYTVTYECTVMGGLATIWRGSAFNCEDSANMIVLLHSQFRPSSMAKTCNNGVISGRGVRVVNSFYTSQLSIKISFDLIGKTIECAQSGQLGASASEMINETTIPYPPPEKSSLSIVDLELRQITFTWSPVAPDCPAIHYNILASNCGSCPTTANHTTVTCTEIPFKHNGEACTFSLQTVVCGNLTGNVGNTTQGLFKAVKVEVKSAGATASAGILAISLIVCIIVFITIVIILIRTNKRARLTDSTRRRANLGASNARYEEVEHQASRASIAINKNIAYGQSPTSSDSVTITHCQAESHERVYAEIS